MDLSEVIDKSAAIRRELRKVIVGQDAVLDQAVVALMAGGHVLLEGPPGTAKTLLVRALAQVVRGTFRRVQFTPDLMPADITGVNIYDAATQQFVFRAGPIFGDLVLADEINRAPAKTQSALLEAMQERQTSIDGESHPLSRVFTVFATQNPIEYEGTYPLPEAQLDRFMFKVVINYPPREAEDQMLMHHQQGFDPSRLDTFGVTATCTVDDLVAMREAVGRVHVASEVLTYISSVVRNTRDFHGFMLGASPRGSVMLLAASKALAVLRKRDYVTPDDVRDLVPPALRHRVVLQPELEIEGAGVDASLRQVLERTEVPRMDAPAEQLEA